MSKSVIEIADEKNRSPPPLLQPRFWPRGANVFIHCVPQRRLNGRRNLYARNLYGRKGTRPLSCSLAFVFLIDLSSRGLSTIHEARRKPRVAQREKRVRESRAFPFSPLNECNGRAISTRRSIGRNQSPRDAFRPEIISSSRIREEIKLVRLALRRCNTARCNAMRCNARINARARARAYAQRRR